MDTDLSKEAKNYGAFDTYVMWSTRSAVDQRLQVLEVPPFLAHLSTCTASFTMSKPRDDMNSTLSKLKTLFHVTIPSGQYQTYKPTQKPRWTVI